MKSNSSKKNVGKNAVAVLVTERPTPQPEAPTNSLAFEFGLRLSESQTGNETDILYRILPMLPIEFVREVVNELIDDANDFDSLSDLNVSLEEKGRWARHVEQCQEAALAACRILQAYRDKGECLHRQMI